MGKKVMLVEDDASMMAVLSTLLEIEGYQVSAAPAGKALEDIMAAISAAQPDIILLDVHLRSASGYDVISQVRGTDALKRMRVIMTSGMDVKERCLEAGADDFLLKPYMPDELMKKLNG